SINGWRLTEGDPTARRVTEQHYNESFTGSISTTILTKEGSAGQLSLVAKELTTMTQYSAWGGMRRTSFTIDPDGASLTRGFSYYTNTAQPYRLGRIAHRTEPDGRWKRFFYDINTGRKTQEYHSWKNHAW